MNDDLCVVYAPNGQAVIGRFVDDYYLEVVAQWVSVEAWDDALDAEIALALGRYTTLTEYVIYAHNE